MPAQWHSLGAFLRVCREINPFVRRVCRSLPSTEHIRTIEPLEQRYLLTAVSWISNTDGFWDDEANWSTGQVPNSGDDVTIDRGVFNPTITVRDNRFVNTLIDREAIIITSGTLQVNTSTQIDAASVTLQEGAGLSLVASAGITSTGTLNWTGGTFYTQSTTNAGTINITSDSDVRLIGTLTNNATVIHSGAGAVLFDSSTRIFNSSTGLYEFSGSGDIGLSNMGAGSAPFFQNDGTLKKSTGAESAIVNLQVNSSSTSVFLATGGRLDLSSGGTLSGGTFNASTGGVVEISGAYSMEGAFTGSGDSHVELTGSLTTNGTATTFSFPTGMFQWTGGVLGGGGGGLTNNGSITVAPTTSARLTGLLTNNGTIIQSGDGKLQFDGSTQLLNSATGVYDFQGNGDIERSDFGGGFGPFFQNNGTLRKSSGTGISTIEEIGLNVGATGVLDPRTGRINAISGGSWAGANFTGVSGGVFEISGTIGVDGTLAGVGGGHLELTGNLNAAAGTTLNFVGNTFQWLGGSISGGGSGVTNIGTIIVAGGSDKTVFGRLNSSGTINHTGIGRVLINTSSVLTVTETGIYDFQGDGGWGRSTIGGGGSPSFEIHGTLRKSAGAGISLLDGQADHFGVNVIDGQIDVQTGRLQLDDGGLWQGADIHVTSGAVFEMSGDSGLAVVGLISGSGEGRVELNTTIGSSDFGVSGAHATFDFPQGQLYWLSGAIGSVGSGSGSGSATTLVNTGFITIDGADEKGVFGSSLSNAGTIVNIGAGDLNTYGSNLTNQFGGVFEIRSNSQFNGTDQFGNPGRFINAGTFKKTADSGTVIYNGRFDNTATGTIEVGAGRMKFFRGGSLSGTTFDVSAGAVLELAGVDTYDMTGTFTGTGAGMVEFTSSLNGSDSSNPAILDFPEDMFHFAGGPNAGLFGEIVNAGWFHFVANSSVFVRAAITNTNTGTWEHSGTGDLILNANSRFFNQGLYDLQTDADLLVPGDASGGAMVFTNLGTFRKSAGSGVSALRHDGSNKEFRLDNLGTFEVLTGTLSINDTVVQRVGTTLSAGTWNLGAGATLTMPGGGNFTVNQATVAFLGAGATFTNLAPLASNTGSLTLDGGFDFSTVGNLANSGEITLGAGSVLTVNGNYTQTGGTSTLREKIAGRPNTGLFGKLVVTGQASLAGRLAFGLANGFAPTLGDQYQVLQFASKIGYFGLIGGLAPFFTVDVQSTQTLLTAIGSGTNISTESVTPPANGTVGQNASIPYAVQNNDAIAIIGDWTDSVYLSLDDTLSADDVLFARVPHVGGLAANGSYNGIANGVIPNVIDGDYRVIVVADTSADVPDSNRADNTLASTGSVHITVPTLAFDSTLNGTIVNDTSKLYRLDVTSNSDIFLMANFAVPYEAEFLVGIGRIPSPGNAAFSAADLSQLNRQILMSSPQTGSYYIVILGREGAATAQNFSLMARQPGFEVRGASPAFGSNLGQTTVTVTGSRFTPQSVVTLIAPNSSVLTATTVRFKDANTLFATFNLTGLAASSGYDIRVENGVTPATATDIFTVNSGAAGQLTYQLSSPQFIRTGTSGILYVSYSNTGSTDVSAALMDVRSQNAQFRLSDDQPWQTGNIQLLAYNPKGAAGILAPGQSGSIAVQFRPISQGSHVVSDFTLSVAKDLNKTINWNALKTSLQPSTLTASAWDAVFANYVSLVGGTVGSYQTALASAATYLSELGEYTPDITRLQAATLQMADNLGAISQRNTLGQFGWGNFGPKDYNVKTGPDGRIFVIFGTQQRTFLPNSPGSTSYHGLPGDSATATFNGSQNTFTVKEVNGDSAVYSVTLSAGKIVSGRLASQRDKVGNVTTYTTNGFSDSFGNSVTFATVAGGDIVITDAVGRTQTLKFDANSNLISVQDSEGTTTYTYVAGNALATRHAIESITYPDGSHVFYEYDSQGRLKNTHLDNNAVLATYGYSTDGRVTITDATGAKVTVSINEFGDLARLQDPNGQVVSALFDANQNPIKLTGPRNGSLTNTYDKVGNLLRSTDTLGNTIVYTYDPQTNNLESITDSRGIQTTFDSNGKGKATLVTFTDGTEEKFSYDTAGNLIQTIDRLGQVTNYTYDSHNLLKTISRQDGSQITYTYDAHRNLATATDATGSMLFAYDSADRLKKVTYPDGKFISYSYNAQGQRSQMLTQDGFTVNYTYDAAGRLSELKDASLNRIVKYTYDSARRLSREDKGNGSFTTYSYNANGLVASIVNSNASSTVTSSFVYTYDSLSRPITVTTLDGLTTYGYDATGQLTSVVLPGGRTILYEYDAAGNRISVTDSSVTTDYTTNNLNQYTSIGDTQFTYNIAGQLTSKTDSAGTTTYTYNAAGRLSGVVSTTDTWSYRYDALGNLIETIHNGQRTTNLIDPASAGDVVGQYNGNSLVANYSYGLGLASQVNGGNAAYYAYDATGNTASLSGANGTVLNSYSYLPFGETLSSTGSTPNPFTFVGQHGVSSDGNGLFNMGTRWYDPTAGRFTAPDTIGFEGGDTNLYRYVQNAPVQLVDPEGTFGGPAQLFSAFVILAGGTPQEAQAILEAGASPLSPRLKSLFDAAGQLGKEASARLKASKAAAGAGTSGIEAWTEYEAVTAGTETAVEKQVVKQGAKGLGKRALGVLGPLGEIVVVADLSYGAGTLIRNGANAVTGNGVDEGWQIIFSNLDVVSPPPQDVLTDHVKTKAEQVNAGDPNEILGPPLYVRNDTTLPYTIHFENMPSATAPALEVIVNQTLDSDLDLSTFELGDIGFGSTVVDVPSGLNSFTTRVVMPAAANIGGAALYVDITAELNFQTRVVTWRFNTIDPETGDVPANPFAGFLPPNNVAPEGDAFIYYTVRPNAGLQTGTVIDAEARIFFDTNDPIDTPHITSTIDDGVPTSSVNALTPTQDFPSFQVSWSGTDDAGGPTGSGIAFYDVYVSDNGGDFVPFLLGTTQTSAAFTGQVNHTYSFYSIATDNVGFQQDPVNAGQTSTQVLDVLFDFGDAPDPFFSTPGKYPTLLANDGARHTLGSGLFLGTSVDREFDGQPTATANGDDVTGTPDDEDGVVFASLIRGANGSATVTASQAGKLDAWIDFNRDGDWDDAGEQVATSRSVNAGSNNVSIVVPAGALTGSTFARFRLSSVGGLGVAGAANDGEVEDYQVTISSPLISNSGGAVTWTKKDPPVSVLPLVSVPFSNLANGTLTISMNSTGSKRKSVDLLSIPAFAGTSSSLVPAYSGGNRLTLTLQLNGAVTANEIQTFLRNIKFSTKGKGLNLSPRTMTVTLENTSGASSTVTQTINVVKKAPRPPR